MRSLFFRNLFFIILQPGLVAGLFPYLLLENKAHGLFIPPFTTHHYAGAFLFAAGFVIMMMCVIDFAVKGKGTLSPADPTKNLVITGLYRFSRNPMYIGVMLELIGEAIFAQANSLGTYAFVIFICFNIFILVHEEPRLRRDFGEAYNNYCKKVRRWL